MAPGVAVTNVTGTAGPGGVRDAGEDAAPRPGGWGGVRRMPGVPQRLPMRTRQTSGPRSTYSQVKASGCSACSW